MLERRRFRSQFVPTEHFHERFAQDSLAFWVPLIVEGLRVEGGDRLLDVGCGTGGFALAVSEAAGAQVVGLDESEPFIEFARQLPPTKRGSIEWVIGNAEELPFPDRAFDRVLLSFVLHQLASPDRAIVEAARVLRTDGLLLIRTIDPADSRERVPARYFPSIAAADEIRLPTLEAIEQWLGDARLALRDSWRVNRNAVLLLAEEERRVRVEVASRFTQVTADELHVGLDRMRADAARAAGSWVDPRPTVFITASKLRRPH